ncbi:hypothetical protein VKT23_009968 [Stygiomarasmius scandens]|uniref:GATA-type domain-containing protein n=1 Tax=Marasmiellus scandens TaxID=2682957 RepID=A0ABR1JDN1_9AGAR
MGPPVVYPPHTYSHLPPPLTVPHSHPHGYAPVSAGSTGSSHSHQYTSNSKSPPISRREPSYEYSREREPSYEYSREREPSYEYSREREPSYEYSREREPSYEYSREREPSYEYSRERERAHSQSQYHQPQLVVRESLLTPTSTQPQAGKTHTFVPIQTGAPVKKDAPQSSTSPTNRAGIPHSTTMPAIPSSHQHQPLQASASLPTANTSSSQPQPSATVAAGTQAQTQTTAPFPPTNPSGQRICRQCGALGRYKDGKCVEKWGHGPCSPGTVCDRCRKKMKRVERRRMAALGENGGQANQGSNGIQEGEGGLVGPGTTTRMVVAPAASASMLQVPVATSALPSTASSSRAASIVNGTGGSRKGSPSMRPTTQPANGVGTPRKVGSTLGPNAPNGKHVKSKSNDSSSRGSGSGSMMDIDADGKADGDFVEPTQLDPEADITDLVERQVEEELIEVTRGSQSPEGVDRDLEEMLGDGEGEKNGRYTHMTWPNGHSHAPNGSTKSYSSPYTHVKPSVTKKEDFDMHVSQLAGMDRRGQEEDGDGDVSVEMEDADAETDLLEAVHAAEAKV